MSTTIGTLFLDELKDRAVRNIEELTPGTEVIFVHLPELSHPEDRDAKDGAYAHVGIVTEVGYKFFDELHPGMDRMAEDEAKLVILYSQGDDRMHYTHATDSGVIPYGSPGSEWYNPANFVVLLAPLNDEGIMPLMRVSDEFEEQLKIYNSKINVQDYYMPWDDEY